jgi:hypothetical protein
VFSDFRPSFLGLVRKTTIKSYADIKLASKICSTNCHPNFLSADISFSEFPTEQEQVFAQNFSIKNH